MMPCPSWQHQTAKGGGGLFHCSVIQTAAKELHPKFFRFVHIFGVFKTVILEKFSLFWMLFGTLFRN